MVLLKAKGIENFSDTQLLILLININLSVEGSFKHTVNMALVSEKVARSRPVRKSCGTFP